MHYKIVAGLIVLLAVGIQANVCSQQEKKRESNMSNQLFVINVKCRANEECLFDGKEMFIDIGITNNHDKPLKFPLEYVQRNGPFIKLIDTRTKAETGLKRNIANPDLLSKLVEIKPGESVSIEWVITAEELRRFGDEVDLTAEVTITAEVLIGDQKTESSASAVRRIVGKNKQPNS